MRKLVFGIALLAVLAFPFATAAKPSGGGAGNPHVVGDLGVSTSGNSFTISGTIAGLGSGWNGASASGSATVVADITCTSPGGNEAAGQQGKTFDAPVSGSVDGPDHNGSYTFTVSGGVDTSHAKALGCPNNNWIATANITSVQLTSLSLTGAPGTVNIAL